MTEPQSINDTLNVIRKALESDDVPNEEKTNENVLILNKLVKDDGTVDIIDNEKLNKKEIISMLNYKLDNVLEKYLTKWLDKNLPKYLENYFKNKKL